MTKVFKSYSKYYDIFYKQKDYKKEVKFFEKYLKIYNKSAKKLLSLGCGTATYEILFAKDGYNITGVDLSEDMLKVGREKLASVDLQNKVKLLQSDVRNIKIKDKFDAVLELFNVIGYQNTNDDMHKNLAEASRLLKRGGLFMFDCWHMPAVLIDKPTNRVREVKEGNVNYIRKTSSKILPTEDIIEIRFEVFEETKKKKIKKADEVHKMRYFSIPEISYFLKQNGLELMTVVNFMNDKKKVTDNAWDIFVVAKKI